MAPAGTSGAGRASGGAAESRSDAAGRLLALNRGPLVASLVIVLAASAITVASGGLGFVGVTDAAVEPAPVVNGGNDLPDTGPGPSGSPEPSDAWRSERGADRRDRRLPSAIAEREPVAPAIVEPVAQPWREPKSQSEPEAERDAEGQPEADDEAERLTLEALAGLLLGREHPAVDVALVAVQLAGIEPHRELRGGRLGAI